MRRLLIQNVGISFGEGHSLCMLYPYVINSEDE
jgi:hypothetical protein